ncbi:MAG: NAD(P)/FAD-dependent oxidoreductase [Acidobacteriota bacterium]
MDSQHASLDGFDPSYDVVVIGGGPAGSTAATLIADAGHKTLLVERDTFPRFKIGESLIPETVGVLRRLGMVEKLGTSEYPQKYSVQFYSGSGKASDPFYFSETGEGEGQTWQVLRSTFDNLMFENAREHGVDARQGTGVRKVLFEGEKAVGVRLRDSDGGHHDVRSRVVIDATGQRALLSRQLKMRATDPNLKKAAIFAHFKGAQRDEGIDEGATLILQTADRKGWFWFIPLPNDVVSIGVVGDMDHLVKGRKGSPQAIFEEELAQCPGLVPRLEEAEQLMAAQVLNEFSYMSQQGAGDGWVLAGDAFGFLDPMYSTGVLLALRSAEMAADTVIEALAEDNTSEERLSRFEPRLLAGMSAFRKLVYAFYQNDFSFGKFLHKHPEHRLSIVRILVGDVFDRDFSTLYRDLTDMVDLPSEGLQAVREGAASGVAA